MSYFNLNAKPALGAITATWVLLSGAAVMAESIELESPMQAASLHDGNIDMVVFYLEQTDHFEVVGTWTASDQAYDPARIRLGLVDGDAVRFSMPGHMGVLYSFSRHGNTVEVSAEVHREPADVSETGILTSVLTE